MVTNLVGTFSEGFRLKGDCHVDGFIHAHISLDQAQRRHSRKHKLLCPRMKTLYVRVMPPACW